MGADSICYCTDPNAYLDPSGICQCKDEWASINSGSSLCVCDDTKALILTSGANTGYCMCKDAANAVLYEADGVCRCKDFENAAIDSGSGICSCIDTNHATMDTDSICKCKDYTNAIIY